jgi:hypothetical protein
MGIVDKIVEGGIGGIFSGLTGIISTVAGAITGKTPLTPEKQAELLMQAANLEAQAKAADTALQNAQIEVNKIEAASADPFVRRWRPAVGWACVCGLVYQFLICPILPWIVKCVGIFLVMCGVHLPPDVHLPILPTLNDGTLISMLGGILGLGAYRTVEKVKNGTK